MHRHFRISISIICLSLAITIGAQTETTDRIRFRVSMDPALTSTSVSGRLIVFMTSTPKPLQVIEPRLGENANNLWLAAKEVRDLRPGEFVELDPDDIASPQAFSRAPSGNYQVAALLDVDHNAAFRTYTEGDFRSAVMRFDSLTPARAGRIQLELTNRVAPSTVEAKGGTLLDFVSPSLTAFWRRPIHMRGVLFLPPGYSTSKQRYPTVFVINGFGEEAKDTAAYFDIWKKMDEGNLPPMIWAFIDESFPSGTHEFVDSPNNGPWGHALTTELIPYLERTYRMDGVPRRRFLKGHSSGGWATLWLQVTYPAFFGGTWATSPDPVDFRDFFTVNLYSDANMYKRPDGTDRPIYSTGSQVETLETVAKHEAVLGEYGGQMSSLEWVFSPRGPDGRPLPLFNRNTGAINREIADYWLDHYDISRLLTKNAPRLSPQLRGKIHVVTGTEDNFGLHRPIRLLQEEIERLGYDAKFTYLKGRKHFDLYEPDLLIRIAIQIYGIARPRTPWQPKVTLSSTTELMQ